MALFRRSAAQSGPEQDAAGPVDETSPDAPEPKAPMGAGPYDLTDVPELGRRVDLGAVRLPMMPGLELRMEADRKSGRITGASCAINGSALQVQAFAAPRTAGIWDEIRGEIAESVRTQGGSVDDIPGTFGRELLARLPATAPDGSKGFRPVRFVGVDGPRWFVRGVITGAAAVDAEKAKVIESIFANIVVARDETARPPRDLLDLHLPGDDSGMKVGGPAGATAPAAPLDPMTRGPEIQEIR
ncbi:uncharacterized protein DUF3710 [Sediminihabitans luteus]|uniref:Uncharacterized protein DUF3710 n=1 Tax=Sediminihabitans luteus TaxID=1138585 RepID=A0A2M9CQH0_9CELL|nr:DUF3710 domain-containing protein [Sediminihabitans luteus]PJJ74088.1 uncharacterized protein DUF3710 [Sediminihabitans luteus]GII97997.1 hypothetical protein Slu03_03750 [Sediminihabitans luteus]